MPKVKLLVNSWKRTEKDEDGNKIKRRYRKGAVIDVTNAEARTLLREHAQLGPVAEEVKATESTENKPQASTPARPAEKKA